MEAMLHSLVFFGAGLLVFSILVFVHELGHFLLAKLNGVAVLDFAIGFGPRIWSRKVGETLYSVRIIPLGGYVRMVGDDPKELGLSGDEVIHEREQLGEALDENAKALIRDRSRWFLAKKFWPKFSIVLAGPFFNLAFAMIVSAFMFFVYGSAEPVNEPVIGNVVKNQPADLAGLKVGDRVLRINDEKIKTWDQLAKRVKDSGGEPLLMAIERSESTIGEAQVLDITVSAKSDANELDVIEGKADAKVFRIGITPKVEKISLSLGESIQGGFFNVYHISRLTILGMVAMIKGWISPTSIAGPIFIFSEASKTAKKGLENLLAFLVLLSVSLGVLNLLPIPVLDGGHLVFFTIEAISGRPLNLKFREAANQVGIFLLLCLMIFAIFNDLSRSFGGNS